MTDLKQQYAYNEAYMRYALSIYLSYQDAAAAEVLASIDTRDAATEDRPTAEVAAEVKRCADKRAKYHNDADMLLQEFHNAIAAAALMYMTEAQRDSLRELSARVDYLEENRLYKSNQYYMEACTTGLVGWEYLYDRG